MTNSWHIVDEISISLLEDLATNDDERCAERLAGERCLLTRGHDGQHAATAIFNDQESE